MIGWMFVFKICFKRLLIVVLLSIFVFFLSFIFGIKICSSLYILFWRYWSCWVCFISLIYCFFGCSFFNVIIKFLLMFFMVSLWLFFGVNWFFIVGEDGLLMIMIFFFLWVFCLGGCLMMLLFLLCVFLILLICGLKNYRKKL